MLERKIHPFFYIFLYFSRRSRNQGPIAIAQSSTFGFWCLHHQLRSLGLSNNIQRRNRNIFQRRQSHFSRFFPVRNMPFPGRKFSILVHPKQILVVSKSAKQKEKKIPPSFSHFTIFLLFFSIFPFFPFPSIFPVGTPTCYATDYIAPCGYQQHCSLSVLWLHTTTCNTVQDQGSLLKPSPQ